MAKLPRNDDLEIEESIEFQRREWRAERIGWAVMGVVILLAVLGFFGGAGPFQMGSARADRLEIRFDRFARLQAPARLQVRVQAGTSDADTVAIWIDRDFLESIRLEGVTPEPDGVDAAADRLVFSFSLLRAGESIDVTYHFTTLSIGLHQGRVGLSSGSSLEISQFTFP